MCLTPTPATLVVCPVAQMVMLALFSAFMQAGCGAVFAVVPFVSVRANGLVTGAVAACGNLGALVLQVSAAGGQGGAWASRGQRAFTSACRAGWCLLQ
jgi:nitrate/nitrite transporter NarK